MKNTTRSHDTKESVPNFLQMLTKKSNPDIKQMKTIQKQNRKDSAQFIAPKFHVHKARWLVEKASEVPEDFPFEDFSIVTVHDTALTVAYRIDECLRKRSVVVKFNTQTAEAVCKTASLMIYNIRLYEGVMENTIIVEVQRWKDCGLEFREEREAIFEAAKGYGIDDSIAVSVSAKKKSVVGCVPKRDSNKRSHDDDGDNTPPGSVSGMSGKKNSKKEKKSPRRSYLDDLSDMYTPMAKSELKQMLEFTSFQLKSTHSEVQLLALHNLTSMTNIEESHLNTSLQISKLILSNEYGLGDRVTSLSRQDIDRRQKDEGSLREQICLASLQVIFNVLESISTHFGIEDITDLILDDGHSCFSQSFLAALIEAIGQYEMSHIACLATKCLSYLLKICPELLEEEALREDALRSLKNAESYGRNCHMDLETEVSNTIGIIRYMGEGEVYSC